MKHDLDAVYRDRLDILFANRNQAYGAYQLRRAYPAHLGRALFLGLSLVALFLALPYLLQALSGTFGNEPPPLDREYVLQPPRDIDAPSIPPPPVETPPPPVRATQRFIPPTVVEDHIDETPAKAIDELLAVNKEIAGTNQEGDPEALPSIDEFPESAGYVESVPVPVEDNGIYTPIDVQKMPVFGGGESDLLQYLAKNIQYPALARENNIQGTVVLTFVVGKNGQVSDVEILKEIGGGCGKEAIRVVKSMPNWRPGEANGHPVKVRFTLPVRFKLN